MRVKSTFRSLSRYRLNSSIIIVSLALGMACMNLITIFITRENNADGFQKNKDRIFALQADDPFRKGEDIGPRHVFFVEDKIMVGIKAIIQLEDVHLTQAINYLEAYKWEVGLLINLESKSLDFKRVMNKKNQ